MTNAERRLLAILAAVNFTNIVDFMIIMPLGPQLMRTFNIDAQAFSFMVSAYTFTAGASGILGAFFLDRFDRKRALAFVYAGFTLGTLACAFAPDYLALTVARCVTGVFGGLLGALALSMVGDSIAMERRATAMSVVMAAFSLAAVVGVPLGLVVANNYGWNAPFLFLTGLCVVVWLLIVMGIDPMRGHLLSKENRPHPLKAVQEVIMNRNRIRALAIMALLMFSQFSIIPFLSLYMVHNVGFTEHDLTYIYILGGTCTIVTSPIIGKIADRFGKKRVFVIMAIGATLPVWAITNMPAVPLHIALIATTLFFIFISGRGIPVMALITATVEPRNRASFMSVNSAVQQVSSGVASFIAGLVVLTLPSGALAYYDVVGYLSIAATVGVLLLIRPLGVVSQEMPTAAEQVGSHSSTH